MDTVRRTFVNIRMFLDNSLEVLNRMFETGLRTLLGERFRSRNGRKNSAAIKNLLQLRRTERHNLIAIKKWLTDPVPRKLTPVLIRTVQRHLDHGPASRTRGQLIDIRLRKVFSDDVIELTINSSSNVIAIKNSMADDDYQISFEGNVLNDDDVLSNAGIKEGSELFLIPSIMSLD